MYTMEARGNHKILLIHGFGTEIRYFLRKGENTYSDFQGMQKEIDQGTAMVFKWGIPTTFSFLQSLNPFEYHHLYEQERKRATSPEIHEKLAKAIESFEPDIIMCHSMGTLLLTEYLEAYGLPHYVAKIIFIQGSIPRSRRISTPLIRTRLEDGSLTLLNVYCPWDPSLWANLVEVPTLSIGLLPFTHPHVRNKLVPLYRSLNLHLSTTSTPIIHDLIDA